MKGRTDSSRRAFTLIELLVVIAIIAILAAILFPVFAKAREKARMSTCQSNLKQLATATMQYVQDYDEKYPAGWTGGGSMGNMNNGLTAQSQVQTYLKNYQVYKCPSDTTPEANSYLFNSDGLGWKALAAVDTPAQTLLWIDGSVNPNGGNPGDWESPVNAAANYGLQGDYTLAGGWDRVCAAWRKLPRHMSVKVNAAYADGHVKVSKDCPADQRDPVVQQWPAATALLANWW